MKQKGIIILVINIIIIAIIISCAQENKESAENENEIYGVPEVLSPGSSIYWWPAHEDELIDEVSLIVIGQTSQTLQERTNISENPAPYKPGIARTLVDVDVLEVIKDESGYGIRAGEQLSVSQPCGYIDVPLNGPNKAFVTVYERFEGSFPILENRPYLLFLVKSRSVESEQLVFSFPTMHMYFDITQNTPTQWEISNLSGESLTDVDYGGESESDWLSRFESVKKQLFEHPLLAERLKFYLE